jgi:tRNA threonylcarbamoyladenosine biosynthesis protein TsaE
VDEWPAGHEPAEPAGAEQSVRLVVASAEDTAVLGMRMARLLRAGDVVLLTGELGAGKTTFVQGMARGLGVRGPVTSPTFVISRVHPSLVGGPALVHVDAYRLHDLAELDDLDLDVTLDDAVTVVEWGGGFVESLATDRLDVNLDRARGDDAAVAADETRRITVTPVGDRWQHVSLGPILDPDGLAGPVLG